MNKFGLQRAHAPGRLTGFALVKIRRLLSAGHTPEQVAAKMRVSVRDVVQAEGS